MNDRPFINGKIVGADAFVFPRKPDRTFAILGTPRSRTAWFAKFLSYGGYTCEHEPSRKWSDVGDIPKFFVPGCGASDSMLTLRWRDVAASGIRIVVVMRPILEVIRNARTAGLKGGEGNALMIAAAVAEIAAEHPGIPIVPYSGLTPDRCAWIFSYLLGIDCPKDWLEKWVNTEVVADIDRMWRDAAANREGIRRFYGG